MKKIRWSILIGIFAIITFYVTCGVVFSYLLLNAIEAETSGYATLFDNWWQVLLFVIDIFSIIGLLGSITMKIMFSEPNSEEEK